MDGRLVAIKNPLGPDVVEVSVKDSLTPSLDERLVRYGTPAQSVRVADSRGISSTVDIAEDGTYRQTASCDSRDVPQNEDGAMDACRYYIEKLNEGSTPKGIWNLAKLTQSDQDSDVDFAVPLMDNPSSKLSMQVTRAFPTIEFYRTLRTYQSHSIEGHKTRELASSLKQAIEKKSKKLPPLQRANIVLLVDVGNTPILSLSPVVDAFVQLHQIWLAGLGFMAVWAVGPASGLVKRLDDSRGQSSAD
ncbi:MAG: hypothetical protein H8K06_00190 [Nitrospira sp.]|jgi:hypothetical protein|nr:hypothetical protein [Nitrospira sp.]